MHLPGCTVPPLVDWLSGTVALASSCYGHPEPGTDPPPWSELAINHHCPSVRPAVTMSVPLYTTCSAEQFSGFRRRGKESKGKGLFIVIRKQHCTKAGRRSVPSHCTFAPPHRHSWPTSPVCILKQGETGAPGGKPRQAQGEQQRPVTASGLTWIVKGSFTHSPNSETICVIGMLHYRTSGPIFVYFMVVMNFLSFVFKKNVVNFSFRVNLAVHFPSFKGLSNRAFTVVFIFRNGPGAL